MHETLEFSDDNATKILCVFNSFVTEVLPMNRNNGADNFQVSRESFRRETFGTSLPIDVVKSLSKAGFFRSSLDGEKITVKCFACALEMDYDQFEISHVNKLHQDQQPECHHYLLQQFCSIGRSKRFVEHVEDLKFEIYRIHSFIDWPISWLSPLKLAADGFYYLRKDDHCACIFCRGIVGGWEEGDDPRTEHSRHFSHCRFIQGFAVGNVPLNHSAILDKLLLESEDLPYFPPRYIVDTNRKMTRSGTSGFDVVGCKGDLS